MPGKVYLVGAGPGDPGLVTLRAKELIERCDALVYDYLANPDLLQWTKVGCEKIFVGKQPNLHAISQEEIEKILVKRAKAGESVVRLKGGDPFVFGRGGEEAETLQKDGVPYEIVPGVTAALASAAYAGIPLTHRNFSSSVSFLTGHEDPEKHEMHVDFEQFATVGGTLCIYMGMGHLAEITARLLKAGLSGETPVAIVQWATTPRQRSLLSTLAKVATAKEEAGLSSPAVVIIGEVAKLSTKIGWFEQRPLFGRRVVVTRSREQASELSAALTMLGAEVLELPLIEVAEDAESTGEDIWPSLGAYRWLVFTSPNGVKYFFEKFHRKFDDLRCIGGVRIACVGETTAQAVREQRLVVDLVPDEAVSESLAEALLREETLENETVLVVTGNRNRDVLIGKLEEGRAIVDAFPVYRTELTDLSGHPAATRFRDSGADAITFASSSAVDGFVQQAKNLLPGPGARRPKGVAIGPKTAARMREIGLPVDRLAKQSSIEGLVKAVQSLWD
ncbi:uroporphyrinogen-III C-methyltransferase [Cerasicoccus arenae]|uniref:uroporphyrinogen-III C-methyltransferase n=1 Tax=Cerasicoccus arenae TaxID=424488 RepID=A0A8J3GE69_9BACT|nr:uroporphyrinogen-III C-methyltransferase [Cerasicoccus arenae]GHC07266.1 uroporphyrinogen III methyltransferase [Cerasicoccus arenae]